MKITFLGTGTSHGIPVIACGCPVCRSDNPKNKRLRTSVLIELGGKNILIDTPPDFREQMLRYGVKRIDAILYTHHHADHIFGLDDVRRFNEIQCGAIPCYAAKESLAVLKNIFSYTFNPPQIGGGVPQILLKEIPGEPFEVCGQKVEPVGICHGKITITGFRIGGFAYVTDCSRIPDASMRKLYNLKVLVLGVLRHEKHSTHFSVGEGVEAAKELGAERTFFTHMCHRLEHEETNKGLPENIKLAYDGMVLEV
jgi:phosphoribosyl 1,2-cyclic phosphate phosphodiesterase